MKFKKYSKYSIESPEVWALAQDRDVKKESKFLIKLFKKYGKVKSILDVGCGVGSHVNELTKKGYTSKGVDADQAKIKYAKKRYPNLSFDVQFMQTLKVRGKFDAIICIGNIIAFNRSNEEVMQTFKSFFKHLKKRGILILGTSNPISYIKNKNFRESFVDTEEDRKKFGIKAVYSEDVNERKQTTISTRTFYTLKGNKKVGSYSKESRWYFPQEIEFFLEQAGFNILEFFSGSLSSMTLKDTKLNKRRMLVVAKK